MGKKKKSPPVGPRVWVEALTRACFRANPPYTAHHILTFTSQASHRQDQSLASPPMPILALTQEEDYGLARSARIPIFILFFSPCRASRGYLLSLEDISLLKRKLFFIRLCWIVTLFRIALGPEQSPEKSVSRADEKRTRVGRTLHARSRQVLTHTLPLQVCRSRTR